LRVFASSETEPRNRLCSVSLDERERDLALTRHPSSRGRASPP
jgi:hypothetical protein